MKKLILILCIPFIGIAQTDYELAFNSTNSDYVEIPNASSLIVNSTTFSMSAWVYPQANPAAHSAIMGFRNNTDADFYLLQLQNSNNVEARFRNSSGTIFDVLATNLLDFNQWQHLAFTYDGSNIYLYKNGFLVSSTPANGVITQMSQTFKIGALDWGATGFYMNGSLDEIRLWNATLSPSTITNWMCAEVTTAHTDYNSLAGYWRLNEGVGTTATDLSVNSNNGTLNNNPTWQVTTSCFGSTVTPLTYVPDDNFENYLEANGMGDGIALNDSVLTSNINTVTSLNVSSQTISDLTGIEDFTSLTDLNCNTNQLTVLDITQNIALTDLACNTNQLTNLDVSQNLALTDLNCNTNQLTVLDITQNIALIDLDCNTNQLTSLDVSQNLALTYLYCSINQIPSLDVSQNLALTRLDCGFNQLTSLDVSQNLALDYLYCKGNELSTLDVSNNSALTDLSCNDNKLTSLNLRNGNNSNFTNFISITNPSLKCIDVDDAAWSTTNWTFANNNIDAQQNFSTNCSTTGIQENTTKKELLKITDLLGREAKGKKNEVLFYIYDDGVVEKKIIIE